MNKKTLFEIDCIKFITTAFQRSGWYSDSQILQEVIFTDGKIAPAVFFNLPESHFFNSILTNRTNDRFQ